MSLRDNPTQDLPEEEQLDWELEQGIPQFEDPFIQKYLQGREALIDQEAKHRSGQ